MRTSESVQISSFVPPAWTTSLKYNVDVMATIGTEVNALPNYLHTLKESIRQDEVSITLISKKSSKLPFPTIGSFGSSRKQATPRKLKVKTL